MIGFKEVGKMKKEVDERFEQYNDGLIHLDELLITVLGAVGRVVVERKQELLDEKRELDHSLALFADINV